MLKLNTKQLAPVSPVTEGFLIGRVTENLGLPEVLRNQHILLVRHDELVLPEGFLGYLIQDRHLEASPDLTNYQNVFVLPPEQDFIAEGDVLRLSPKHKHLSVMYRKNSKHNSFLVTERCNNYCLMCSQPPKDIDDSYIVNQLLEVFPLVNRDCKGIGLTGGEPTLLGDGLIKLIRSIQSNLPEAGVHILSNGRSFAKSDFARKVAEINHKDLMIGIPVYSDVSNIHDYVVQADGAFDETIRGILNLKRYKQKVEIRVVIHKQTYDRLPQLAEYIVRNLLFVDHVALMGLEMMGFTRHNLDELWIDPADYQSELVAAVRTLSKYKMTVSVYNHQLCVLDPYLHPFAVKSISDWKNEYMPECEPCTKKTECGGFFSSAKLRYSSHIKPVLC